MTDDHEKIFENALAKIAALQRGGIISPGTVEADRDFAIGEARQALIKKYGMAWGCRVEAGELL
jgi:hypothetical protein